MTATRRAFRAESLLISKSDAPSRAGDGNSSQQHREILAEIASIKELIRPTEEVGHHMLETFKAELGEAFKLKAELDSMYEAIAKTKREIATLHNTAGSESQDMTRVTNELDAVVLGTEGATEGILSAAEFIDETANTLSARLAGQDAELANDIQEKVVQIFESCNFQDLTGQRITKVINTLRFIEDRIVRMMDIWGGIETFKSIEPDARPEREGDGALLNGPSLDIDAGVASQDDIDALFA
ncbi:protein phosphatase CheZ [Stappia sp. ES.058]|uniref:protein phosphatase CheZ n=1 Tax=Stappia sp. ES.058 TaxID=1881061 RepID=UPI00087BC44F|nr:protein phosphatase CheZ [Stappia sp. ES.058]SDT91116.1 chemotaxis protein CheZ [Stappia sp. ES.058]